MEETTYKVLVVEDDLDVQELIVIRLEDMGHETKTCGDGLEALELAKSYKPDLVVLDIGLPGLSGTEVCKKLRGNYPELPILILTARLDARAFEETKRVGATDFLVKPFKGAQFAETLEKVMMARKQPKKRFGIF